MTIQEWISNLEANQDLSLEEFYGKLLEARHEIEERLQVAEDDDIDLELLG